MKRGLRFVRGGDKELIEKLGREDPCPCGSGKRFQALLPDLRPLSMARGGRTIGATERAAARRQSGAAPALKRAKCGSAGLAASQDSRSSRQISLAGGKASGSSNEAVVTSNRPGRLARA